MAYVGIDPGDSSFVRRDADSSPTLTMSWTIGTPALAFKGLYVGSITQIGTDAMVVPVGPSIDRPANLMTGMLRYNTTISAFEGLGASGHWSSLGGVIDVSGNTFITAEDSPGADNNQLKFYTNDAITPKLILDADGTLLPGADLIYDIGSSTNRFNNIYVDTVNSSTLSATTLSGTNLTATTLVLNASPTLGTQVGNRSYNDGRYLQLTGGTMTGMLTLSGDPSTNLQAATKQYVDNNYINHAGGTMTGTLTLAADPVSNLQAATKHYVDNLSTTAGTGYVHLTGDETIGGNKTFSNDVTVTGNLNVLGTSTTISTTNVLVTDAIITLASNNSTAALPYIGLKGERGATDEFFVWNESSARWGAYSSTNDLTAKTQMPIEASMFYGPVTGAVTGNLTGSVSGNLTGNVTGNADTATKLATSRTISITTDATGSASFDGSSNSTIAITLASVGTAGTYTKVTTDAKGRVISSSALIASDIPSITKSKISDFNETDYLHITGGTLTGGLTLSADPTTNLQASTKQYVDNTTVVKTGSTMTGALTLSGDPTANLHASTKQYVDNAVLGATPTNNSIALNKLVTVATNTLLGRASAGTGNVETITTTQALDMISTTPGTIIYRGTTTWDALAPGQSGQILQTTGSSVMWANQFNTYVNDFTGDNVTTSFNLTASPVSLVETTVYLSGVYQQKNTYSIAGTTITFTSAPPLGVGIEVLYPTLATGTTTIVSDFVGTGSQTVYVLPGAPSSLNNTTVYFAGLYQQKNTYSLVGNTITFTVAPPNGTSFEVLFK